MVPFHTPGHKLGRGGPDPLVELLGVAALRHDPSDQAGGAQAPADTGALLAEAEARAARWAGARRTWFLWNGTTSGIHAMLLAACPPGSRVALPRACHVSAVGALILGDLLPVFLPDGWDPVLELPLPPGPGAYRQALADFPDIRALLVVRPTYYGLAVHLPGIAAAAARAGALLLVDEAHGAHFGLHPRLPRPALALGADLVAQSTHKTLGALTQASMLHLAGQRLPPERVERVLGLLLSTSPSSLLLASLDAARAQAEGCGRERLAVVLQALDEVRHELRRGGLAPLTALDAEAVAAHGLELDPCRLVIDMSGTGMSGLEAMVALRRLGVQLEMADARYAVALGAIGDDAGSVAALEAALRQLALAVAGARRGGGGATRGRQGRAAGGGPPPPPGRQVLPPRRAFLGAARPVAWERAVGAVSADWVAPYPPGTPLLVPGEEITRELVRHVVEGRAGWAALRSGWGSDGCRVWVVEAGPREGAREGMFQL